MSVHSTNLQASRSAFAAIGTALGAAFARIAETAAAYRRAAAAAREAEFLYGLSDAKLAERGLSRDKVAEHIFRAL